MKLWIDVEDLFHYAHRVRRPSGIQRLAFEVQRALSELSPDCVRFVRHGKYGTSFVSVPFTAVESLFSNLADYSFGPPDPVAAADAEGPAMEIFVPPGPISPPSLARRLRHRLLARMAPEIREPAIRLWIKCLEMLHASIDLTTAICRFFSPRHRKVAARLPPAPSPAEPDIEAALPSDFDHDAAPGDWLLVLGSPWSYPDYATRIATHCQRHGMKFAVLLYDIIPIRRPEWVDQSLRDVFASWFHSVVPLADQVFAISRTTAADVERYERETKFGLRGRVLPVPVGTGFGRAPAPTRTRRLPAPGHFALIVSTIEARKNHLLLFRIWRALSEQVPAEKLPILVFAGRIGWLVTDLIQQLDNTNWLDGKVMLVEAPTDGELACLYRDCLFTLYPSLYEGWGLPVTESLTYGAPCLAANRTSLPEAGGRLAEYFDPDHLHEAVAAVRRYIDAPELLDLWRARIAREFRPVAWTETAAAMLAAMQESALDRLAAE
jgi:glycosyltransferase involved in cell wall biosynthesis